MGPFRRYPIDDRIIGDNVAHLFIPSNGVETSMEEKEGWAMYRPAIIVVAILILIFSSIFLYVYSERGLEGFIDWFFNGVIGLMFTGFMILFVFPQLEKLILFVFPQLGKLEDKLLKKIRGDK